MRNTRVIVARVDIERWEEQEKTMQPGSTIDVCRVCDEPVWMSPEGNKFTYHSGPDNVEVVCVDCHIRLEIERRKKGDEEAIKTQRVPGARGPLAVATFSTVIEEVIKEGLREQAAQELAGPLPVVREVQGELDEEVERVDAPQPDGDDPEGEPQDSDQEGA